VKKRLLGKRLYLSTSVFFEFHRERSRTAITPDGKIRSTPYAHADDPTAFHFYNLACRGEDLNTGPHEN
jgi:hypothetical protein